MDITAARQWVRRLVRDGTDDTLEQNEDIDRAIQTAGDEFCRITRSITKAYQVAITSGSTAFPLTTPIAAGFRPERALDVIITGKPNPLQLVGYPVLNTLAANDANSGVPTHLAFLDNTSNGVLWRTPDADYTAALRAWQPFTSWTPGTTDGPTLATFLNIPDDLLREVLVRGATAILKAPSPEKAYMTAGWQEFQAYCKRSTAAVNLGARTLQRARMSDCS